MEEEVLDFTKLKYALYARKSSDDKMKQVRSIPDQISDCEGLQDRLGLNVAKPYFKETKSAKIPRKRPIFRKLIDDIKAGKYDAILTWSPDRLSRNMLEAGEVIDLVDQKIIKDIKFYSTSFTVDPQGLMMLGMSFVLSKQYSDDLSQKIKRGVRKSRHEGKTATFRHGYIRDEEGYQIPDGKNFDLIKRAWQMRYEGSSLEEIANYMNENGYRRFVKRTKKYEKITFKMLSGVFKDPFYYGLLCEGGEQINLTEKYEFVPATTDDVFFYIQKISKSRLPSFNKRLTFFPLKGIVKCAICHKNCVVAPSKGHLGTRYLYYRCDNPFCLRKKRSIRAKEIFKFIYEFFEKNLIFDKSDYDYYVAMSKESLKSKQAEIDTRLKTARAELGRLNQEQDKMLLALGQLTEGTDSSERAKAKLNEIEGKKDSVINQIKELEELKANPDDQIMSLEKFLNLVKNATNIVKSADAIEKDHICRSVFLNLEVDEVKVANFRLKEPFESLVKMRSFPSGGDGGNRTRVRKYFIQHFYKLVELFKFS